MQCAKEGSRLVGQRESLVGIKEALRVLRGEGHHAEYL